MRGTKLDSPCGWAVIAVIVVLPQRDVGSLFSCPPEKLDNSSCNGLNGVPLSPLSLVGKETGQAGQEGACRRISPRH